MMFSHFRQGRRPVTGKDRDARFPSRMGMGLLLAALLLLPGCAQAVPDSGAPLSGTAWAQPGNKSRAASSSPMPMRDGKRASRSLPVTGLRPCRKWENIIFSTLN